MTLTTHIVIAAAVAKPLAAFHPVFPFLAAFASHYLADAIPHWDYELQSVTDKDDLEKLRWSFTNRSFFIDLSHVALDGLLGAGIVLLLVWPSSLHDLYWTLAVIVGGALPDFLEGVYYTRRAEFLKPLHRFHVLRHTKIKLGPYPLIGIPFQIIILLLAIYFLF